ncbi:MAG: hypothetical protein VX730_09615 [Pseudomonadota bacterium]|nr:hypothetical protein [Pseudomonadota bacterium]
MEKAAIIAYQMKEFHRLACLLVCISACLAAAYLYMTNHPYMASGLSVIAFNNFAIFIFYSKIFK